MNASTNRSESEGGIIGKSRDLGGLDAHVVLELEDVVELKHLAAREGEVLHPIRSRDDAAQGHGINFLHLVQVRREDRASRSTKSIGENQNLERKNNKYSDIHQKTEKKGEHSLELVSWNRVVIVASVEDPLRVVAYLATATILDARLIPRRVAVDLALLV